ncbi:MAG: hypothetical protein JSR48_11935 [Verrucomicrobia bacterium]|nr:hypothetical protein [Verrucomicrobiota bacterium]
MSDLIADMYVILWKHFESARSKDQEFLASAVCGGSVLLAVANLVQLTLLALGQAASLPHDKPMTKWVVGVTVVLSCVAGMKFYLKRHPELQSSDEITIRWSALSRARKNAIVAGIYANLALFVTVPAATFH